MKRELKILLLQARPYTKWMALAALLGFLTVGSGVGLMMTAAYIISRAALHPPVAELQVAIVGVRFFGISRALFRYLERLTTHSVTLRLLAQFRIWFFDALEPLVPARTGLHHSGDLLSRVVTDVETLQNFYIRVLAPPLVALLVTLSIWLFYGLFDPAYALILLAIMLLAGWGVPMLTLRVSRGIGSRRVMLEAETSVLALEGIQGMSDLMVFGGAAAHFARFGTRHDELLALIVRQKRILALHEAAIGLLMNCAIVILFLQTGPQIHRGGLDGVYLAVLALGVMAVFEALLPLPGAALCLEEIARAAERLSDIIDERQPPVGDRAMPEPGRPAASPLPATGTDGHREGEALPAFAFHDITFRYGPGEESVLEHFSFAPVSGTKTVLIGPSGSGKSTLIQLLLGFREAESGRLCVGGRPIGEWPPPVLTSLISVAPQPVFLFSGTLRENLLLGNPQATPAEMERICRQVGLLERMALKPEGLETPLGEGGLQLSGGERRLLAIARALLKETPILLLDEPTGNLDAGSERTIWQLLEGLNRSRSILVLSHRLPPAGCTGWQIVDLLHLQPHRETPVRLL
jgi:thiol reductant ABC exporter CydC subunit